MHKIRTCKRREGDGEGKGTRRKEKRKRRWEEREENGKGGKRRASFPQIFRPRTLPDLRPT